MIAGLISQIVMDKCRDFPVLYIVVAKIVLSTHGLYPKYLSQNSKGGIIRHFAIRNTKSDCKFQNLNICPICDLYSLSKGIKS